MKIVKEIINILLSFGLCFVLLAGFVALLLAHTLLSQEYVQKKLAENEYCHKIEIDLQNGIEEYQYQSGLPSEVFENLYTSQMVKEDVESLVRYLYMKTEITNHAQDVKEKISENIAQYLTENQLVLTEQQQKNVDDFEEIIAQVYENKVNSLSKYWKLIEKAREKVDEGIKIAKQALGIALLVILAAIGLVNGKEIRNTICVLGRSFMASGILLVLVYGVVTQKIDISNILLFTQSFSDLVKEILQHMVAQFCYFGIGSIVIGLGMIAMASFRDGKKAEK